MIGGSSIVYLYQMYKVLPSQLLILRVHLVFLYLFSFFFQVTRLNFKVLLWILCNKMLENLQSPVC